MLVGMASFLQDIFDFRIRAGQQFPAAQDDLADHGPGGLQHEDGQVRVLP